MDQYLILFVGGLFMSHKCSLQTQTHKIWLIVRKNQYIDEELIKSYLSVYADEYAYILHEHDIDINGVEEGVHYHFVYNLKEGHKRDRLSTTLNHIVDCFKLNNADGVQIEKYDSFEGCLQYLTHKNQPSKTQHKKSDIITNLEEKDFDNYYNVDLDDIFSFDKVYQVCLTKRTKIEVIRELWIWYSKNSTYQRTINEIWNSMKGKI